MTRGEIVQVEYRSPERLSIADKGEFRLLSKLHIPF